MKTKRGDCDYIPKYNLKVGHILFCSRSPEECPYGQSLKISSQDKPLFRCLCDGKVEKIVREKVLATQ